MPKFVPDNWELSERLRYWTASKGLTDAMIDAELEHFRLYEWAKPKTDFDRCWQTRILLGLKKGWIELPREMTYRQPDQQTPEGKAISDAKANENLAAIKAKLHSVK